MSRGDASCSWVGLEWALPGVVVSIVVPLSVSIGHALELLISDVVVGVGVWSASVDTLLSGDKVGWLVHQDGLGGSSQGSDGDEFHFLIFIFQLIKENNSKHHRCGVLGFWGDRKSVV